MSGQPITISAMGLCSSLGGFHDACAAYRAGLNRFAAHEEMKTMEAGDEEPTPLTVAPAATNLWMYQGVGRSVKMLHSAYLDLLANYRKAIPTDGLQLLYAGPDPMDRELNMDFMPGISRAERLQEYIDVLTAPLLPKMGVGFTGMPVQCVFGDRIAFARILQKAMEMLSQQNASHCLLMVADSLLDDGMLDFQLENDFLKHGGNPVGYIPGEGAAMFLLSADPGSSEENRPSPMTLSAAVTIDNTIEDTEEGDTEQWMGSKLLEVIKSQVPGKYEQQLFPQWISDINGEENRAIEMGNSHVKLRRTFPNTNFYEAQVPALGFGECGAMMGPLALATAMASVQRGYARQREFLITLSEYSGKRAAIYLHL